MNPSSVKFNINFAIKTKICVLGRSIPHLEEKKNHFSDSKLKEFSTTQVDMSSTFGPVYGGVPLPGKAIYLERTRQRGRNEIETDLSEKISPKRLLTTKIREQGFMAMLLASSSAANVHQSNRERLTRSRPSPDWQRILYCDQMEMIYACDVGVTLNEVVLAYLNKLLHQSDREDDLLFPSDESKTDPNNPAGLLKLFPQQQVYYVMCFL